MADLNRLQSAQEVQLVTEFGPLQTYRNLNVVNAGSTVKNSPGMLYGLFVISTTNGRYLKIYDKATPPVVGTDTPVQTIPLFASIPIILDWRYGLPFQFGLGIGATTGIADTNTQAPGTNQVVAHIYYA